MRRVYPSPLNKHNHGLIFKCFSSTSLPVTTTLYPSTTTIHIQGAGACDWLDDMYQHFGDAAMSTPVPSTPMRSCHRLPSSSFSDISSILPMTPAAAVVTMVTQATQSTRMQSDTKEVQTETHTCVKSTQHGESLMSYTQALLEIERLKQANCDLKKDRIDDVRDCKELRQAFKDLAQAHNAMCERNNVLQAKISSLQDQQCQPFQTPNVSTKPHSVQSSSSIPLSNPFSTLANHKSDTSTHATPLPPQKETRRKTLSSSSPRRPVTHVTRDAEQVAQPLHVPAEILIFSNSICGKIDPSRFYRGKSTRMFAKGGARIGDIQRLVEDTTNENPTYVILQAWTNSTASDSMETCERQSRFLIEATLLKFPSAHIIISGVLPRFWDDNANRVSANLNRRFSENCKSSPRVSFVEHVPHYLTHTGELIRDLYWDDVHLSYRGLGKLVSNLRNAISRVPVFPHSSHVNYIT